jgi:acetolactate synthase-1/2/3 large subunit
VTAGDQRPGGAAVVDVLRAKGVTQFFTVPGESFLPVLEALRTQDQIRVVTNRHESGAAFAAEGFAKITGRPAVCMATRGPGASNLAIGIHTAYYDRTPLIALVGLIPSALQGTGAFQDFDLPTLFGSMAKRAVVAPSRASLEAVLSEAVDASTTGRPGPVVVGLPSDFLTEVAATSSVTPAVAGSWGDQDISRLIDLIVKARRPAFVMSTGAVRGRVARDVGEVALRREIPVVCGWRRFSAFDNGHPCFAGSLGLGMLPSVRETLDRSDLVVAFGPLEQITIDSGRLNRPRLTVVNVDSADDPHLQRRLGPARLIKVVASPDSIARSLAGAIKGPGGTEERRPPETRSGRPGSPGTRSKSTTTARSP